MEQKQDRRVTRTQRAATQAMMTLLSRAPFSDITVNDICTEAMISRSTFYAHFEDKYALLRHCLEEVKQRVLPSGQGMPIRKHLREMLQSMQRNAAVIRNLFFAELDEELMRLMRVHFVEETTAKIGQLRQTGHTFSVPDRLLAIYCAGGLSSVLMWWVEDGFKEPLDSIEHCLYELMRDVLGIAPAKG